MIKTDLELRQDIESELAFDPRVYAAQIAVSVDDGAVTLQGTVATYGERDAAERAAKRVAGVRTLAQDLRVKRAAGHLHPDQEIATAAQAILEWDVRVPKTVTAMVEKGSLTLGGDVNWHYEREAAERAVRNLEGVVQVFNTIALKSRVSSSEVKQKVQAAILRHATSDASAIRVESEGAQVTLSGSVSSWQSIDDALAAAWAAPGVTQVIDHLKMTL